MSLAEDIAWAAGLIEGEGCIGRRGGIGVAMRDEDVIRHVASVFKAGTVWGYHEGSWWKWKCSQQRDTERIVDSIYPYLGQRRREAADAQGLWYARPHPRKHWAKHRKVACPNCSYETTPAGLVQHRRRCDREEL